MFSRTFRRSWPTLALLLTLAACEPRGGQVYQQQFYVFGTLVDIMIQGAEREQAVTAANGVAQAFQQMHQNWHAWHPGPLVELNQALAASKPFQPEPSLLPLIQLSQELSRASDGLFNPAIGSLMTVWGFHQDELPNGPPPAADAVAALVARHPGMDDIDIQGNTVSSRNPAVQLDFGAIAKGYALDRAVEHLRRAGIENAIINAGGNLRAFGQHGDRPWRIGIRHPSGQGVLASLEIQNDESVLTSGDYERYFEYQGKRYAHIIDPRTGQPVDGTVSVTVIAPNGALGDAASTALAVAGVERWREIARRMGITQVMLVEKSGVVHMTPAMAQRIRFEIDPPPETRIEE